MSKGIWFGVTALLLTVSSPAPANMFIEPTFAEKMARAEVVLVATVDSAICTRDRHRGSRLAGPGSTAVLAVNRMLKGEVAEAIEVSTYSRIAEHGVRCLTPGATYLLFLRRTSAGQWHSVAGVYGLIPIGGPPDQIRSFPSESKRRTVGPEQMQLELIAA